MLCPHKDEHNYSLTMLIAGCTQQDVVSAFGANQSNVRQLNMRLHQLNSAVYTPRTRCPRVTIPRQDRQIRLLHLCSHFTTAVKNQGFTAQTVVTDCKELYLVHNICTFECSFGCSILVHAQSDSASFRTTQSCISHGCAQVFCRCTT
jgi:hypothetical protein